MQAGRRGRWWRALPWRAGQWRALPWRAGQWRALPWRAGWRASGRSATAPLRLPDALVPDAPVHFRDRNEAGERLATTLAETGLRADLILAIPRGGVAVAVPVARRLGAPLDVLIARKVGAPGHAELAIGAVTSLGAVWNTDPIRALGLSPAERDAAEARADAEVRTRAAVFRAVQPAEPVRGRRVLLVDDGLATGATMAAAVSAVQQGGARSVVAAAPVGAPDAVQRLWESGAMVVLISAPAEFGAVGAYYDDFRPLSEDACLSILRAAAAG